VNILQGYMQYLGFAVILYILSYGYYVFISHGLGNRAFYLQMRRFVGCVSVAVIPAALAGISLRDPAYLGFLFIAFLWCVTYPTIYWYSNHKVSSDFGFHIDFVFGLYAVGLLTGLLTLSAQFPFMSFFTANFIALIEVVFTVVPLVQWIYFFLYGQCITEAGMQLIQQTHYNEIIEYFKSMPVWLNIFGVVIVIGLQYCFYVVNYGFISHGLLVNIYCLTVIFGATCFCISYLFFCHPVWKRTALAMLYLDVKDYLETNLLYGKSVQSRREKLNVKNNGAIPDKPSTVILIIGESESRDYMSAFVDYPENTTPWLKAKKEENNFILFSHAYAVQANTVPVVECALTEKNQYNGKKFYESCSIIDVAKKLGYYVRWYSNQGHLGCCDTPVTLIADTADVTKWTKQKLNQVQYDEALLDYLKEAEPEKNNFIVLHLKGSHFNYMNRYPKEFTKWGTPGKYHQLKNYLNSVAYTDSILEQIFNYAKENLNLQSMIYFSDHGCKPDKRRSPDFNGFSGVRIPMFIYFSDEYIKRNEKLVETLREHKDHYWTNDLAYEMICDILGAESENIDKTNSLASEQFKYTRDMLLTDEGRRHINEDNS